MLPYKDDSTEYVRKEVDVGVATASPVLSEEVKDEENQYTLQVIAEVLDRYKF